MFGLHYIEDDRHSILIVVADEALVSICRIGSDNSISFVAALGRLMVRNDDPSARGQRQCSRLCQFFMYHMVCVNDGQWLNLSWLSWVRIDLLSNVHALPIFLEQFLEVLSLTNELLAGTCTAWSICYLLGEKFWVLSCALRQIGRWLAYSIMTNLLRTFSMRLFIRSICAFDSFLD